MTDNDADIARLRAYMVYSDLSIRSIAHAAGVSRRAVEFINLPDRFKPRRGTLQKMVAIIPPDFTEERAAAEYRESCARVRAWFDASGLKRYQLKPMMGVPWEWVQDIASDDWSPSWFALRKLLTISATPVDPATTKG